MVPGNLWLSSVTSCTMPSCYLCSLAVQRFSFMLEGRLLTAFINNKPLTFAMAKLSKALSTRQQRHISYISEFTTEVRHVEGKANVVADCLFRALAGAVIWDWVMPTWLLIRQQTVRYRLSSWWRWRLSCSAFPLVQRASLFCAMFPLGPPRPVVPTAWRQCVFDAVHSLSHPGRKASQRLEASKFIWSRLKKDVQT